jgi:hypothetical protein
MALALAAARLGAIDDRRAMRREKREPFGEGW